MKIHCMYVHCIVCEWCSYPHTTDTVQKAQVHSPHEVPCGVGCTKSKQATLAPCLAASYGHEQKHTPFTHSKYIRTYMVYVLACIMRIVQYTCMYMYVRMYVLYIQHLHTYTVHTYIHRYISMQ